MYGIQPLILITTEWLRLLTYVVMWQAEPLFHWSGMGHYTWPLKFTECHKFSVTYFCDVF